MPPKERKGGSIDARPAKKVPQQSAKASYKLCPNTGDKIWITTVTLSDLKKAKKTGECPSHKNRKELVRIPSFQEREKVYWEAAHALESKELECLPLYGKRQWSVSVSMAEDANKKPPLFRWFRGDLELAVLPHLLQKFPDPPQLKGLQEYAEDEEPSLLAKREVSALSQFAWEDDEYGIPIITTKWLSPNHQYFYSRKTAWCEMQRLAQIEILLQKSLLGLGGRDQRLHPTFSSRPKILELGEIRFLRDGLWVVGQEDQWQEERKMEITMEAERKQALRATFGSKCLDVEGDTGSLIKSQVVEPQQQRPLSGLQMFLRTRRDSYRQEKETEMSQKLTLRQAEQDLREVWKTISKEQQDEWKERSKQQFAETNPDTSVAETESASLGVEAQPPKQVPTNENYASPESLVAHEASDTLVSLSPDPTAENASLKPAANDISEVKLTRVTPSPPLDPEETATESSYLNMEKAGSNKECVATSEGTSASNPVALVPVDDSSPGKMQKKTVSNTDCVTTNEGTSSRSSFALAPGNKSHSGNAKKTLSNSDGVNASEDILASNSVVLAPNESSPGNKEKAVSNVDVASTSGETSLSNRNNDKPAASNESQSNCCAFISAVEMISSSGIAETTESKTDSLATNNASSFARPVKKRRKSAPCPTRRPSAQWRLSPEHIDLCFTAAMDHFEMVMNTVKARALHAELQDGFDFLRERGRGRYDMELPIFDTDAFSFLNNLQGAAWMPIVRQVLGPDVVLIHKGVFLSMPGAEAQVYHQDGTHLTTKSQRPCHAVNVFIPLVDLHSRNGPTEFCLGSHIIDHDGYDPNRVHTPLVLAGTPVMFDYRLGHRGMSNSSSTCRPIVYCTYAASANGKEFRDLVNFSRKRYHTIGELVEKPLSREERIANRRKRVSEAKETSEAKEIAEAMERSETIETSEANALEETILSHEHSSSSIAITAATIQNCDAPSNAKIFIN